MKVKFEDGPWEGIEFEADYVPSQIVLQHLAQSSAPEIDNEELQEFLEVVSNDVIETQVRNKRYVIEDIKDDSIASYKISELPYMGDYVEGFY